MIATHLHVTVYKRESPINFHAFGVLLHFLDSLDTIKTEQLYVEYREFLKELLVGQLDRASSLQSLDAIDYFS